MNTLCWSLTKNRGDISEFFPYMYDLYYLSMAMARELGYNVVLYGNTSAIQNLKDIADSVINIDFLDYQLFDDPKVYIWASRADEYATIDGDVFLYKRINFRDTHNGNITVAVENNQTLSIGQTSRAYNLFSECGVNRVIPFWESYRTDSYNTGIIKWNDVEAKNYYLSKYYEFRRWFLDKRDLMGNIEPSIVTNVSIGSHLVCEHLLYKMIKNFKLNVDVLKTNSYNDGAYSHFVGADKYTNIEKWLPIKLLVEEIREMKKHLGSSYRFNIKGVYMELAKFYGAI